MVAENEKLSVSMTYLPGATRARVAKDAAQLILQVGPGYSAWLLKRHGSAAREISVSLGRNSLAHIVTDIAVCPEEVRRRIHTSFASGIVRDDLFAVGLTGVIRDARWRLGNGDLLAGSYAEGSRHLELIRGGELAGHLHTTGSPNGGGFEIEAVDLNPAAETSFGDMADMGKPGKGFVVAADLGDGHTIYHMQGASADGRSVFQAHHHYEGRDIDHQSEIGQSSLITVGADGTMSSTIVATIAKHNGDTGPDTMTVIVSNDSSSPSGGAQSHSTSVTDTNGEGAIRTISSFSDGSSGQKSAWVTDGQGNESQTTITYAGDGSFTIETHSTDAQGNESGSRETYDKDGNPIPSTDGGNSGGGGGDGGGDSGGDGGGDSGGGGTEGGDDGHSGGDGGEDGPDPGDGGGELPAFDDGPPPPRPTMGAEGGELPAFDGGDPPPRPNAAGPAGLAFLGWEAGLDPFLGGSYGTARTGPVASPAGLILSALGDEGDGDGSGGGSEGSEGDDQTGRYIRAVILRELDPENNPRALLEALGRLRGIAATSAGYRAAEAAILHFERDDTL